MGQPNLRAEKQSELRDNINYFSLYNLEDYEFTYVTTEGINECITTSTFKIPQLISRMWATKLLGENPAVSLTQKDTPINDYFDQDIISQFYLGVHGLMAIGRVFIYPYMTKAGKYDYDILIEDRDNVKFYEQNGELQYLSYTKSEIMFEDGNPIPKLVTYEHYMENGAYYIKKYLINKTSEKREYLDGHDGTEPISKIKMLPFKVDLKLSFNDTPKPIWANAYMQIIDVYHTYTHMTGVMERLTPLVAIPGGTSNEQPGMVRGNEMATIIGGHASKVMTIIPGLDEQFKPQYFGGGYDPEPFLKHMDLILNNISEHCGLGHRALSYDQQLGVLKTATEVTYSHNDAMINKSLLDNTVNEFIRLLIKSYYYMKENTWLDDKDITITNEDSVFNSREERVKELQFEIINGIITEEYFLQEVHGVQDVSHMINKNRSLNEFGI